MLVSHARILIFLLLIVKFLLSMAISYNHIYIYIYIYIYPYNFHRNFPIVDGFLSYIPIKSLEFSWKNPNFAAKTSPFFTFSREEDPNFHQLAPLLAYGDHALGRSAVCPRDGRLGCALVDRGDGDGLGISQCKYSIYNIKTIKICTSTYTDIYIYIHIHNYILYIYISIIHIYICIHIYQYILAVYM